MKRHSSISKTLALTPAASDHLNMARALAALAVAAGHIRGLFFVDYQSATFHNILLKAFYFVTSLGHEAVIVFFVLSGFLVSRTVLRYSPSNWSAAGYASDRLSRLYTVLIPALLWGAVLDAISKTLPGARTYFLASVPNFSVLPFAATYNLRTFGANLFFLQNTCAATFGSNGPLWSLANEFWYYVLWPCLFVAFLHPRVTTRIIAAGLGILALLLISPSIWILFPVWLLGASIHRLTHTRLYADQRLVRLMRIISLGLFAFAVASAKNIRNSVARDFVVGVAFTVVLYLIACTETPLHKAYGRTAGFLAGFSFSLYATHFPLLLLLRVLTWRAGKLQPNPQNVALGALYLLFLLAVALLFSVLTEARTAQSRQLLRKFLLRPRNQSQLESAVAVPS